MTSVAPRFSVTVFSRAPVPGNTKRRLIPALGPQGAAALHERMLRQVLEVALELEPARVTLACTPDTTHPFFLTLRRELGIEVVAQQGEDLGARMSFELARCLENHTAAIIVGSDCPALETDDLRQAFNALDQGKRVALGPSSDGGYYLIGLNKPTPELFSNMPWGSGDVFAITRQRLEVLGCEWLQLSERTDIDRPEDLGFLTAK